ncbi:MAG: nucleotidyltransferase domain-containing protein [Saccharofermentanales bacterium]
MNLDKFIQFMAGEISHLLDSNPSSIYLYGSITLGDFREGWSDIDILVLTKEEISQQLADQLVDLRQVMTERFPKNPYFNKFEGGILPLDEFLYGSPGRVVYWGTSGQKIADNYSFDSFSVAGLLESGVLLRGNDVRGEISRPTYGQLRDDVNRHYLVIRQHALKTGRCIYSYGWLLDIARGIYTLRTGQIIAKTAAGQWALDNGICPVPGILQKALDIRKNPAYYKNQAEALDDAEKLGSDIQWYADVLEEELANTHGISVKY